MWDADAKKLAIKAIGTVESNLRYDAINYRDPITVGISQWYATRAANLLKQIRGTAAWVGVETSLDDDLGTYAETNANFWTGRLLTRAEGESLRPVLVSDIGVQTQNAQTIEDLEVYKTRADRAGLDADNNTNGFIFWCVMYHQSPKFALEILANAGANPSIDRLHSMALNHRWFGDYKSRFDTAKAIILSGDHSGIPDFGVDPSDPEDEGGDSGTPSTPVTGDQKLTGIRHVRVVGDNIHIVMDDGSTTICYPTGNGYSWLPTISALTPVVTPPTTEPNPTQPPDPVSGSQPTLDALVAFLVARIEQYAYTQGYGRDNPDVSGATDCSALMAYAYRKVAGIEIGTYTVDQQRYGSVVWSNLPGNSYGAGPGDIPPKSVLQKGDLCYFAKDTTYVRVRHVEMYMGVDNNHTLIGWGSEKTIHNPSGKGPYIKPNYENYMNIWRWHVVRRHL